MHRVCQVLCGWYSVFYLGLEHLQVLVSSGCPGTNTLWAPRGSCNGHISASKKSRWLTPVQLTAESWGLGLLSVACLFFPDPHLSLVA